jgi:hypothetical protein
MTREEATRNTSISGEDKSPWSIPRHLPESNNLEELRRFANLVWNQFYSLQQQTATVSSQVMSNASGGSSGGGASTKPDTTVPAPGWVYTIAPPFAVLRCNTDGSMKVDSRGYGYIQKVL